MERDFLCRNGGIPDPEPVVVDVLYPEELPQLIGQTKLEAELIKNLSFEGVG